LRLPRLLQYAARRFLAEGGTDGAAVFNCSSQLVEFLQGVTVAVLAMLQLFPDFVVLRF